MPSDLYTVYRAADVEEADIVVAWLDEQGIAAVVTDRAVAGALEIPVLFTPHGIEVCVGDRDEAERAIALLRDHYEPQRPAKTEADAGRTIEAVCEECGTTAVFPFALRGKVQDCPDCGAYLDVPGEGDLDGPEEEKSGEC